MVTISVNNNSYLMTLSNLSRFGPHSLCSFIYRELTLHLYEQAPGDSGDIQMSTERISLSVVCLSREAGMWAAVQYVSEVVSRLHGVCQIGLQLQCLLAITMITFR